MASAIAPIQYQITRQHGTERAFSSLDFDISVPGIFRCVCCGQPLCRSSDKYESGTGRSSFTQPVTTTPLICLKIAPTASPVQKYAVPAVMHIWDLFFPMDSYQPVYAIV